MVSNSPCIRDLAILQFELCIKSLSFYRTPYHARWRRESAQDSSNEAVEEVNFSSKKVVAIFNPDLNPSPLSAMFFHVGQP